MKPRTRSFPHPVVGNRDDVPDAAFQATVEVSSEPQKYTLATVAQCSSSTIRDLIAQGSAAHVLHVECGGTMFRQLFEFADREAAFEIPAQQLAGDVEVMPFVIAKGNLDKYRPDGLHKDYGSATFRVQNGDILAIGEGTRFPAEPHDTLRSVGSIMQIELMPGTSDDCPMKLMLAAPKVLIYLCKKDYDNYKRLKNLPEVATMLATMIVVPALAHVIAETRKGESRDLAEYRWYGNLTRRIEGIESADSFEPLVLAQKLLELPLSRALQAADRLVSGATGRDAS